MSDWKNVQYKDGKMRTSEGGGGGGSSTFAGLDDVSFSNLQNGQVPKYNSETHKWENANESGGGTVTDVEVDGVSVVNQHGVAEIEMPNVPVKDVQVDGISVVNQQGVAEINTPTPPSIPDKLSDLSDVQFSNLTDHQPLRYNATSQKWVNGADNYPPLIYSDEEREVGAWRDGKPLYQKSFYLSTNGTTEVTIDVSALSIDTFLFVPSASYKRATSNGNTVALGFYVNSDDKFQCFFRRSANQIAVMGNGSSYLGSIVITIRYTKTTDTAGSGTWTTQGGYAHHYSTTEHIIGTWIDGKPLYEKTYDLQSVITLASSYSHSGIVISAIKKIISIVSAIDANGQSIPLVVGLYSNNELAVAFAGGPNSGLKSFTLQYTKTTD